MPRRRALLAASLPWGAASTRAGALTAATERPIRVLVPYTPGAINDILARLIAERFQEVLGQLGVVENRPGASGSLALAATAQAAPDGGTIVIANTANLAMNPFLFANTGYDPQKDLAPLATVARVMNVMVVPAASPFRSPADVVAAAKAAPGQLTFASSGAGSSPHLAAELFKARSGTDKSPSTPNPSVCSAYPPWSSKTNCSGAAIGSGWCVRRSRRDCSKDQACADTGRSDR